MANKKEVEPETALVLRTCTKDMTGTHEKSKSFVWPSSGPVSAPDWNPEAVCGCGLHGLIDGWGDYSLLSENDDAVWQVVEVIRGECIDLNGKVKFPAGNVIYSGSMAIAMTKIGDWQISLLLKSTGITDSTDTASGNYSTQAASGNYSKQAASGNYSRLVSVGNDSEQNASGKSSIAMCAGLNSVASAGERGAIALSYWDNDKNRYRIVIGYIEEDGLMANTKYRLNDKREFEEVK